MSRSYKKHFYCKEKNSKSGKQAASRAVRRTSDILNGGRYKKLYCSWNISDYKWRVKTYTAEEFRKKWYDFDCKDFDFMLFRSRYGNWKEAYRKQLKWYITK